jgi:hypothetical protein
MIFKMNKQNPDYVIESRAVIADSPIIVGRESLQNTEIPWIHAQAFLGCSLSGESNVPELNVPDTFGSPPFFVFGCY